MVCTFKFEVGNKPHEYPVDIDEWIFMLRAEYLEDCKIRYYTTPSCSYLILFPTNEYTSYISNVHDVTETLGQATFNVKEVMFLMKMTNFQRSDNKVHKKIWSSMEETLDEPDDNIPINARKISRFLEHKETLQRSTRLRRFQHVCVPSFTPTAVSKSCTPCVCHDRTSPV
jgi:hypothetical protein